MEKIKVESKVYANRSFMFAGELVKFVGCKAEISEGIWNKIQESKFPGIFEEGKMPDTHSRREIEMTDDIKAYKAEMEAEVARLKGIVQDKNIKIGKLETECQQWRNLCADLQKGVKPAEPRHEMASNGKTEESAVLSAEEELRKELKAMKVDELKDLAKSEGIEAKDIKDIKKDELVEMLIAKSK